MLPPSVGASPAASSIACKSREVVVLPRVPVTPTIGRSRELGEQRLVHLHRHPVAARLGDEGRVEGDAGGLEHEVGAAEVLEPVSAEHEADPGKVGERGQRWLELLGAS